MLVGGWTNKIIKRVADPYYTKTDVRDEWNRLWTTSNRTKIRDFCQEIPFSELTKKTNEELYRTRQISRRLTLSSAIDVKNLSRHKL